MVEIMKKTWSREFEAILYGRKKFDTRLDDFEVKEGDILILKEWDTDRKEYTGREIRKKISYVLKTKEAKYWAGEDVNEKGFVVISLEEE